MLVCDPPTYTFREEGKGSVVKDVGEGVMLFSSISRLVLPFVERVKSRCGVLMVVSFLRMAGYRAMDNTRISKKKAVSFKV